MLGVGRGLPILESVQESIVGNGVVGSGKIEEYVEAVGVEDCCFMCSKGKMEGGLVSLETALVGVNGSPRLIVPFGDEVEFKVAADDLGKGNGATKVDVGHVGGFGDEADA